MDGEQLEELEIALMPLHDWFKKYNNTCDIKIVITREETIMSRVNEEMI